MRKSARTPAAGGGLVEVDDRTVFARCFPKSWINVVRIYETATSPPGSLVGSYPLLVSSVLSAKRKSASVRGRRGGHAGHRLCTNRRRCCVSPGRFCVGGGVVLIRTIRGCTPIVGGGGVVRNADTRKQPAAGVGIRKGTRHTNGCVAGAVCEVVGSAVTYSPTPSRGQYHRRGRA